MFDSPDHFGALGKHRFTFEVSDVVEIDVHGEPRQAQVEQVESGAAFQNESSAEEGVFLELGEEFAQSEDFLEVVGWKARGFCSRGKA